MLKFYSFLAIILIGLAGCSRGPESATKVLTAEEQFVKGKEVKSYTATLPDFIELPPLEQRRNLFIPAINLSAKSVNGDWRVADKRVREHLDKYKEHPLLYSEAQFNAAKMLAEFLLLEKPDKEVQQATAFYTELLDYYQSKEFVILSNALKRLKTYWPDEKIKQVALKAKDRANQVLKVENSAPIDSPLYNLNQQLVENARQSQLALNKLTR